MRTTIYHINHQEVGYVADDTVYTRYNEEVGKIKGNEVYNTKGHYTHKAGQIEGNDIYRHSPYFRNGHVDQFNKKDIYKGNLYLAYSKGDEPLKAAAAFVLLLSEDD